MGTAARILLQLAACGPALLFIEAESRSLRDVAFTAWFAGGPLLVAAWNTVRMFAKAPIAPLPEAAR